jgi:hypothetical protein
MRDHFFESCWLISPAFQLICPLSTYLDASLDEPPRLRTWTSSSSIFARYRNDE